MPAASSRAAFSGSQKAPPPRSAMAPPGSESGPLFSHEGEDGVVVLTGAMIPYAFGSSDGLFNLGSALSFVQVLPPGVYVAMNGQHFAWDKVRKNRVTGIFEALER